MQVKFKLVYLDKHYVVLWPETDLNENIKKALGQKILCFVSSRSDLRVTMCYTVKNPTSMNLWFIDQKNIIIYFSVINVRCINKEIVYYTLHGSFLVSWIDCKIILCYIFQKVLISRVHMFSGLSPKLKTEYSKTLLYAESISAWSNQGSVMCLLSILNQWK